MIVQDVRVHPSKADLKREDQLAWKIAGVAADRVAVTKEVAAMIINRIIDNASVAIASSNRHAIVSARDMALARPNKAGASVFGVHGGGFIFLRLVNTFGTARRVADALRRSPEFRSL